MSHYFMMLINRALIGQNAAVAAGQVVVDGVQGTEKEGGGGGGGANKGCDLTFFSLTFLS